MLQNRLASGSPNEHSTRVRESTLMGNILLFDDRPKLSCCRCVVSRKGVAVDMSTDHKPEDDAELARIEKAGGEVVDGRVQVRIPLCSLVLVFHRCGVHVSVGPHIRGLVTGCVDSFLWTQSG